MVMWRHRLLISALLFTLSTLATANCLNRPGLPKGWQQEAHAGQVYVKGGSFSMGSQDGYADERPIRAVKVAAFWIDQTEVTNAQFESFVKATGYVTDAEKLGGSAVFEVPTNAELQARPMAWWRFVKGANWRHPQGPSSHVRDKDNYPVVHITQRDALAFAHWLKRDLPTEAQWEYAAKAGGQAPELSTAPRDASGRPSANYWQGNFPLLDLAEDGHAGIAPVACYAPNALGLYDTIGNVWEWTRDTFRGAVQGHANGDPSLVQRAASKRKIADQPMVIKGGSFLCSADYCVRYRASARESQASDIATSHVGFRTVSNP